MQGLYRPSKLRYLNLIIFIIQSYLIPCALAQKLIFLDAILKKEVSESILNHTGLLILVLLILYTIFFFLIEKKEKEYIAGVIYNNICQEIFTRFVKPYGDISKQMKVSLLKAYNPESESPFLKIVGRYQTKSPKRKCRITFKVKEGCAGLAYAVGSIIVKDIPEYDRDHQDRYFLDSQNNFNLPQKKARKLNDFASQFLCIPVKYFGKEDVRWGALSIDSMEHKDFLKQDEYARKIEDLLSCYSVFFVL
jgi:hypothetical protein